MQAQVVLSEGARHFDTLRYYIAEGITEVAGGLDSSMPVVALRNLVVVLHNVVQTHSVPPVRSETYSRTQEPSEALWQVPDKTETHNQPQVHPEVALEPPDGTKTNHEPRGVSL